MTPAFVFFSLSFPLPLYFCFWIANLSSVSQNLNTEKIVIFFFFKSQFRGWPHLHIFSKTNKIHLCPVPAKIQYKTPSLAGRTRKGQASDGSWYTRVLPFGKICLNLTQKKLVMYFGRWLFALLTDINLRSQKIIFGKASTEFWGNLVEGSKTTCNSERGSENRQKVG